MNVFAIVMMRETYAPVILAHKAARLRKATKNPALRSKLDRGIPIGKLLIQELERPLKLLLFSPIVLLLSIYVAFCFGLTFLLFTTFPSVYSQKYHFKTGVSGLAYLGMGIGFLLGVVIFASLSDKILKAKAGNDHTPEESDTAPEENLESQEAKKDAPEFRYKPELRLFLMACVAPVLPFGFFWYGWSAEEGAHWIVPILGTGLIGVSLSLHSIDSC